MNLSYVYSEQFPSVNIFLNWNIFVNFEDNIEDTKLPAIQYVLSCDSVACFTVCVVHRNSTELAILIALNEYTLNSGFHGIVRSWTRGIVSLCCSVPKSE